MRSVLRRRYYCDHCKKSGGNSGHMRKHEQGCCRNPDRVCGMCKVAEEVQAPIAELVSALESWDAGDTNETVLNRLKTLVHNCPACILSGIIQWRKKVLAEGISEEDTWCWEYDFDAEVKAFWARVNEANAAGSYAGYEYAEVLSW